MTDLQKEIDRFSQEQLKQACLVSRSDLENLYQAMDNMHAIRSRLAKLESTDDLIISAAREHEDERLMTLTVSDLNWLIESIDKLTDRFSHEES